ncbi:SusC/RagA family TonB-linked outer membrane protein [Capnocytophaga ochracea]|jgi:tonB-linked outer membrane protein, susC/ragA family|uniref:SusC/RagA family TonB-linked outer membrane protein n=1 Tax=Capnocytophaga ochracea TaxID=1018 RepID=UPI002232197D|nr:TonB-dependent receptor [Capnocytophaga ochracea]UZD36015.1 TonB-dependent receptor [Capnocytophaga ochracea]
MKRKIFLLLIALWSTTSLLWAQNKQISGTVTDEKGTPLPGVSVQIKSTTRGVATDFDGKYSIEASQGNVLLFSSMGYASQEKTVGKGGNSLIINVKLKEDTQELGEVVVVGYGSQKKENLTGAIATVDAKVLESRPLTTIGQGLQGVIPNLNITTSNGRPGSGSSFNIRGYTSLNGGSPLVLVDGVQMDPNQINPNDVENVTVLKDAASAAIYGGRAAFGVVLITTKKGKKETPMQINISSDYSITRPTRLPDLVNSVEYLQMYMEADRTGRATGSGVGSQNFTDTDLQKAKEYLANPTPANSVYIDPNDARKYRYVGNTNWIKEMYPGWASQTQNNISLSGGTNKTTYLASVGMFSEDGLFKKAKQKFERYNITLNINTDITKWLSLHLKSTVNHKDNDQPANVGRGFSAERFATDVKPLMPVYHPDGHFSGQGNFTNPFAVIATGARDTYKSDDIWITSGFTLTPIKNVKIVGDYTWNPYHMNSKNNVKMFKEYGAPTDGTSIYDPDKATDLGYYPHNNPATVYEANSHDLYKAANIYAQYENTFAEKHYFKAMVGYNQESKHNESFSVQVKNLVNQDYPFLKLNNDDKPSVGSGISDWALIGSFFRLNYVYNQKYLVEVNGRYDGSSRFSRENRYVFSPSASLGWRISKEKFFEPINSVVSDLKFRVSYGKLPNQQVNALYPYLPTMPYGNQTGYIFGTQQLPYVSAPGLVSNNFTWEEVATRNFGVDFGFLNNRLTGSFDYYIRNTTGMLVNGLALPAVLGVGAPQRNAADLETKGFELTLGWHDAIGEDFKYGISFNLADSRSFITKYDLNPTGSLGDYYVGREIGEIWGYTTEGLYQTDEDAAKLDKTKLAGYKWLAGDVKYKDLNNDGKIDYGKNTLDDHGDLSVIGNNQARYTFGLNLNAEYKGFDFTVFFQGVGKRDYMLNDVYFWGFSNADEWSVPATNQLDHWTPENPNAYYPRLRFGGWGNTRTQTRYMQDASYIRLKQITLGYTLPKEVLSNIGLQNLRLFITGQNLCEWTKLIKSYDPELLSQNYPINRVFTIGVQARF